ncbi:MAG TPA: acyltransferase family protein [Actinomycetota bacterium]|nr:acyltransferase family protein [Actinomycetota bacterium]
MSAVEQELPPAVVSHGRGRIPGLDGMRAIAVLAVMLFHTGGAPLPGGFLGVDVFFVLSGFLIAGILLDELRGTGRIALNNFWLRRARRLAPALLLLLVVVGLARLAVVHPDPGNWRSDMLAALTYTTNWFQIANGSDYFTQFGQPQPLMHTWSLAIEEQFYLMFAALMALVLKRARASTILAVFVGMIVVSAGWMALLADSDPVWAYFGTGTRLQALLVGASLAVIQRRRAGRAVTGDRSSLVGFAGGAVLVGAFLLPVSNEAMFRGGFLVVALASAALIWAILAGGRLAQLMSWKPLVAIGAISYGVYLWHWPIFILLGSDQQTSTVGEQVWAFLMTIGVASASYWAVERPVRQGRFASLPSARQWGTYAAAATGIALLALLPARAVPADPRIQWPAAEQLPTRILAAGDSTMLVLWEQFPREVYPDMVVDGPMTLGCGIVDVPYVREGTVKAPEECVGWQDEWRRESDQVNAEVAVLGSPVWDSFDRYIDGRSYAPGTPEFDTAYVDGFSEAIALAGRGGQIPVYVVGQPCLASAIDQVLNDPRRSSQLDALVRTAVSKAPNARYVDTRAMTCAADGTAVVAGPRNRLREDGVHWGKRGADVFWSTLFAQMAKGL